jgi:hypothetical protein
MQTYLREDASDIGMGSCYHPVLGAQEPGHTLLEAALIEGDIVKGDGKRA